MNSFWSLVGVSLLLGLASGCAYPPTPLRGAPEQHGGAVRFALRMPSAHRVQVVGSWEGNAWGGLAESGAWLDPRRGALSDPDGDGVWERIVFLPAGYHTYRFVVDGTLWLVDPSNPERTRHNGAESSVLVVQGDFGSR